MLAWQALGNRLWCLSAWRVSETLKDYASVTVCGVLESRCECPETYWGPSSLRRTALSLRQVSGVSKQENHRQGKSHHTHSIGYCPHCCRKSQTSRNTGAFSFPTQSSLAVCEGGLARKGVRCGCSENCYRSHNQAQGPTTRVWWGQVTKQGVSQEKWESLW